MSTKNDHAAVGIHGASDGFHTIGACRRGIPFQATWDAGIHAASTALFAVLRAYLLQFAQLNGHLRPLAGHARVRAEKRSMVRIRPVGYERVAVRRDRRKREQVEESDRKCGRPGLDRGSEPGNCGGAPEGAGDQHFPAGQRAGVRFGAGGRRSNPELGIGVHLNLSDGPPTRASRTGARTC